MTSHCSKGLVDCTNDDWPSLVVSKTKTRYNHHCHQSYIYKVTRCKKIGTHAKGISKVVIFTFFVILFSGLVINSLPMLQSDIFNWDTIWFGTILTFIKPMCNMKKKIKNMVFYKATIKHDKNTWIESRLEFCTLSNLEFYHLYSNLKN